MTTTAPPPWFRGFEVRPSTTITRFCGWSEPNTAQTFLSSGSWANCCETGKTTPCSIATACLSSSVLVYNNGNLRTCEESKTCVAQTYYQASPSVGPAVTLLMCAASLQPWPNYRTLAGAQYVVAANSSLPVGSFPSYSPPPTSSSSSSSAATGGGGGGNPHLWIAGAVLGPVVATALGILAFWALSQRRRRRRRQGEEDPVAGAAKASSSSSSLAAASSRASGGGGGDDDDTRRQAKREHDHHLYHRAELGTIHNRHELPSPPATLELPAGRYPEDRYPAHYSWVAGDDAAAGPWTRPPTRAELDSTFSPVTPCLGPDGRPERPYKGWGWFGWV